MIVGGRETPAHRGLGVIRDEIAAARSMLFVPGDRPDRFAKAAASGADVVVLDLEDAVGAAGKVGARRHVRAWLDAGGRALVRINGVGTTWFDDDVRALAGVVSAVMLPKAASAADLARLPARLGPGTAVVPLIETAEGVLAARAVCAAEPVVRPAFGSLDLAAELGVPPRSETLLHARATLVIAAAACGTAGPVDGVTTELDDEETLITETRHASDLGFTGKLCVHPRQIDPVHWALAPTQAEIRWARNVIKAASAGAVAHDGSMVDRPVLARAHRLLARAR